MMSVFPFEKDELVINETKTIRRLRLRNLFSSVLSALNLEKGGLHTVVGLLKNPGELAQEYIGSNRTKVTEPFKLLLITTTLAFLILQNSHVFHEFRAGLYDGIDNIEIIELTNQVSRYLNIIIWFYIPIAALFTWILNRKSQYNYAENMAFQAYYFCLTNILSMLIVLDRVISGQVVVWFLSFLFTFYNVYAYKSFFRKSWWRASIDSSIIYFIASAVFFALMIGALGAYATLI